MQSKSALYMPGGFLQFLAVLVAGMGLAANASAQNYTWRFEQIYSNADGNIQFVVVYDQSGNTNNQDVLVGIELQSVHNSAEHAHDPGYVSAYDFPNNLPSNQTAGRRFLIGTQAFASLNLIKPDFIVEDQFIPQLQGSIELLKGRNSIDLALNYPLPNDGVNGLYRDAPNVRSNLATNFAGQTASVPAGAKPPPPATSTVVEFYNASLDHYFITYVPKEISDLDTGVHAGWTRTTKTLLTYTAAQSGASPVCRYHIPLALGDSHFFGRGTAECNATGQKNPSFFLEDPAFMQMFLPTLGVCPANTTQIYRVFSNRPDANHRYMTDKATRDQMVAKGWLAEGDGPDLVVMCQPQ